MLSGVILENRVSKDYSQLDTLNTSFEKRAVRRAFMDPFGNVFSFTFVCYQ
jgi:hypothetical protein